MMNKKVMMLATVVMAGSLFSVSAFAISEAYRAQLEKSGCTQVSEANGTCNPKHSRQQNKHPQARFKGDADSRTTSGLTRKVPLTK
jgi:hypothetical protein